MFRKVFFRLVAVLALAASLTPVLKTGVAQANGTAIIADHTVVDQYDDIPQYYINLVKNWFLNVPGESHSAGYRKGLDLLESQNSTYQVYNAEDSQPPVNTGSALRVSRWVYASLREQDTGEQEWFTWHAFDAPSGSNASLIKNHLDYCDSTSTSYNISAIGFGWCWDMTWQNPPDGGTDNIDNIQPPLGGFFSGTHNVTFRWAGSSVGGPDNGPIFLPDGTNSGQRWGLSDTASDNDTMLTGNNVTMNDYLQATEAYIQYVTDHGYNTRVFFTTGPVDYAAGLNPENHEAGYQREIKHQYIRDYVNAHGKYLFDYADILTYSDNASKPQYTLSYNGHPYPQIHPDNMMDYDASWNIIPHTEDGDHIGEVGALRLGKALWWLLARMAGWDGNPVSQTISITISGSAMGGITFGSRSPGATNILETHSSNVTPSIVVNVEPETTVNVDLQIKGTNFTNGGASFAVTNARYRTTYNGTEADITTGYLTFASNIAPSGNATLWHWLNVPSSGVAAGTYTSTFSYKAVAHQ